MISVGALARVKVGGLEREFRARIVVRPCRPCHNTCSWAPYQWRAKRTKFYHVAFRIFLGGLVNRSTGCRDKTSADIRAARIVAEVIQGPGYRLTLESVNQKLDSLISKVASIIGESIPVQRDVPRSVISLATAVETFLDVKKEKLTGPNLLSHPE